MSLKDVYDYIEGEMLGKKLNHTDKHNIKMLSRHVGGSARIIDYLVLNKKNIDVMGADETEIEEMLKRISKRKVRKVI